MRIARVRGTSPRVQLNGKAPRPAGRGDVRGVDIEPRRACDLVVDRLRQVQERLA
jgi:hypothetical protein